MPPGSSASAPIAAFNPATRNGFPVRIADPEHKRAPAEGVALEPSGSSAWL